MAQKVRWGVIGAGGIADRRTIPGMMLAENAELVAVMEINMELAEKCRAKWGCKRAYDSEAALLADPEIDAVYIATPVVLHAKQAMMAACDKVLLLADHRKFYRPGLVSLGALRDVDMLITDCAPTAEWQRKLQSAGVEVVCD